MHYVYILYSQKDHGLYIGYAANLQQRFAQHSKDQSKATMHRLPLKLIHYEAFLLASDALAREKYLKSGYGRDQLKSSLKNLIADLNLFK